MKDVAVSTWLTSIDFFHLTRSNLFYTPWKYSVKSGCKITTPSTGYWQIFHMGIKSQKGICQTTVECLHQKYHVIKNLCLDLTMLNELTQTKPPFKFVQSCWKFKDYSLMDPTFWEKLFFEKPGNILDIYSRRSDDDAIIARSETVSE